MKSELEKQESNATCEIAHNVNIIEKEEIKRLVDE